MAVGVGGLYYAAVTGVGQYSLVGYVGVRVKVMSVVLQVQYTVSGIDVGCGGKIFRA